MRLSAYKRVIDEIKRTVPEEVLEFKSYFKKDYNPRKTSIEYVLDKARVDKSLFHIEFTELCKYTKLS